jgi:hypothetical protein
VLAWWCLVLWPCLCWLFVLIVDVLWVLYLQWHHMPSWVSLLYLSHPCHLSLFLLTRGHHKKEAEGRCKLKKKKTSPYFPSYLVLAIYLTLIKVGRPRQDEEKNISHRSTKEDDCLPTSIIMFLFISLLLVSSFFESRDEILFKGGRFVTPWNFRFQDVNRENNLITIFS